MPDTPTIATPAVPIDLGSAIDSAVKAIAPGDKGAVSFRISQVGADVSVGVSLNSHVTVGGYAKRLWGGGWQAGAQGKVRW